jgi:hypothetical protein
MTDVDVDATAELSIARDCVWQAINFATFYIPQVRVAVPVR